MSRTLRLARLWAGVAVAAPALIVSPSAFGQDSQAPSCGLITVSAAQPGVGGDLLAFAGAVIDWAAADDGSSWRALSEWLGRLTDGAHDTAWRVHITPEGGPTLSQPFEQSSSGQPCSFDLLLELNVLRGSSAQPFSRAVRGQVLDALGLDNARRARLAAIAADEVADAPLSIVLFSESRSEAPGQWRPVPIASASRAPMAEGHGGIRPVEIDFGEEWEGVLFTLADVGLALAPDSGAISGQERFQTWGASRVSSLRGIAAAVEGRAWVWTDDDAGAAAAFPLRRGATERAVATNLQTVLGRRLAWGRDDAGRALGTIGLTTADRAPEEDDRRLWVRFITIQERTVLTLATTSAALEEAPGTLAALRDGAGP